MGFLLQRSHLRLASRLKDLLRQPAPHFDLYLASVLGKAGLEIGGPSESFRNRTCLPLYSRLGTLDNCDFSSSTVWASHSPEFIFSPFQRAGRTFVCDGSQLDPIDDAAYDFVLSSHNLEHFANPVKALMEWKRVLRPGGALILVLPDYRKTFDARRRPTAVAHMMEDFRADIGEDDLTHLPEILEKHDLSIDPGGNTFEQFKCRSLDNFANRCLHHHVFDEHNSRALLTEAGFKVLAADVVDPLHLCLLAHT